MRVGLDLDFAAAVLGRGRLVALPTETVYGLGADATNDEAVARLYAAKGRPTFNPLIAHVKDGEAADALVEMDARAQALMERFWPGPLTLVLPRRAGCEVSLLASAGLSTLAIRAPAHPFMQGVLKTFGRPIVAPSANLSGRVSPTCAEHVRQDFGDACADLEYVVDGGDCALGIESTVVSIDDDGVRLLRPGAVTRAALQTVVKLVDGFVNSPDDALGHASPGLSRSHYAPSLPVRLNAREARPFEALLAFGDVDPTGFAEVFWLSREGSLVEAAARLFQGLRRLDHAPLLGIAVSTIPEEGLGEAIIDRLRRAAADRD